MRLWTNIFLPVKALLEFLLTFKDETIAHKLNDTHKSNAGLLLLGAFADWVGNRLSLYLMEAGTDKGQDPLEIRAFWQKERTATLIRIVSKLRFFFGGDGGIRTHVPFYRQLDFETHSPFVLWQNIDPLERTCRKLGNAEYSRIILKFNHHYVLKSRKPSVFNGFE